MPFPFKKDNFRLINQDGVDIIKKYEGCKLDAYQDQVGIWTIGYGHTGVEVVGGLQWSQEDAYSYLNSDLHKFEGGVTALVTCPTNDNQFSALVCLAYNIGLGNLGKSALLKTVNSGDFEAAADHFLLWNRANGEEVEGLTRRRQEEKDLFLKPV